MILVVGATGQLGGSIARKLLDQDESVRILVRPESDYGALVAAGAQPAIGDLKDPDSLPGVCQDVDAIVTTANATARAEPDTVETVDRLGNGNLIDAAAGEGVRHFVFVSSLGADADSPMPLLRAKGETEQRLRDSGMTWTILQPNLYLDKLPMAVVAGPALAGQPVTLVGEGRRLHSMVAMDDVASYAIAALQHRQAEGETLLIGGPQPVSWRDVVTAFALELGRDIPVRSVPPRQPLPGMPTFVSDLLAALDAYDSPMDTSALAAAYGITPTTLTEFVRSALRQTPSDAALG